MATIVPQSELTKKAIQWISEQAGEGGASRSGLIEQAGMRFNLGPKDVEFLERFYKERDAEQGEG